MVDNGSTDGSLELVRSSYGHVAVLALERNVGFAAAANLGIRAIGTDAVALLNTDVELDPDWVERTARALGSHPGAAAVACKMVDLEDPGWLYDTGDILRRDGVCEQRGRFTRDDGRYDLSGGVFAACAGAALYRRNAVLAVGGFDERFFAFLEDVDLGLRLQLAGWGCRYEPAVARHAGGGSSWQLDPPVSWWVERNTLLLVAKAFPLSWAPLVAYRQLGWAWHAFREGRLRVHLAGAAAAVPVVAAMLRERARLRREAVIPMSQTVPRRPIRGHRPE